MTVLNTRRFATIAELHAALGERLAAAIAARGASAIMLSGGETPLPAYRALSARVLPHDAGLHLLFSDERYVPSDSEASNYHRARPLLDALALPAQQLLRVRTELPLEQAALEYEHSLAQLLQAKIPITLGLLGLGADGHTASLFSAGDLARAVDHLAIAVRRPDGMSGVSVTPALLAHVEQLLFVVAGGKEQALRSFQAQGDSTAWHAVRGRAQVDLWVHEAATPA
jgi:6-phosphogluconolactonase